MIQDYDHHFVEEVLINRYGLKGSITQMQGYTDRNFLLKTYKNGEVDKFTIKISSSLQNKRLIQLQNYVFKKLQQNKHQFQCKFPRLIPTLQNQDMVVIEQENKYNFIRVLTFIEGKQMWQIQDAPLHLFTQAGNIAGKLSLFLSDLSNNEEIKDKFIMQSQNHYFNICSFNPHYSKYQSFLDNQLKPVVAKVRQEFNIILPILATIPKQVLHNDICLSNLLVQRKSQESDQMFISGLIDFSSMIYSYQIIELVILCARINLYHQQPLRNILLIIGAYNKIRKISQVQKQVLFPMIKTRLAFLCLLSSFLAYQKNDPYFIKCKNGHILYLETFANYCSNQEFLLRLEALIS